MRGARAVLSISLLESILLSVGRRRGRLLLAHGLIASASPFILARIGFAVGPVPFSIQEAALLPALVLLASLVGYLPALAAYRTDVAKALSADP